MMNTISPNKLTHQQKSSIIRKEINKHYKAFRERYPFMNNQDAIGLIIFLVSVFIIIGMSIAYIKYQISLWIVVPVNAFFMGILHELEHDLIHNLYFKSKKWMQHIMLGVGWILRPLTLNPWIRRGLHYHHHKYSGAVHDIEERGVTNGERWGVGRLLGTPDILIAGVLRLMKLSQDTRGKSDIGIEKEKLNQMKFNSVLGVIPFAALGHILIYIWIIMLIIDWGAAYGWWSLTQPEWWTSQLFWIEPVFYLLLLPNIIRQFSLHFITSNMHYYGDVEDGNVLEQTQVLTVWWTLPMQVFCFFFGWTHAIHHFVVNEPFYMRHILRKPAHDVMREHGVRFNDLGTFLRANRYGVR